jgi:hypothetical protein
MKNLLIIAIILITSTGAFAQRRHAPQAPQQPSYMSSLFSSIEGTYFDLENDHSTANINGYLNILDWLQGRVAGLQVHNIRGTRYAFLRNRLATIYIDEMRVDPSFVGMLPVQDIALVKIMRGPQAGILTGPGGAIAIYTKRGGEEGEEEEEG